VLLVIASAVAIALYTLRPPKSYQRARRTRNSPERAMKDLKILAKEPRPVGSQGHTEAQQYILREIRGLGLKPRMQSTTAVASFPEASLARGEG
jgi:hypothetical protein